MYVINQVNGVNISLDEQVMTKIFEVPTKETRYLKDESGSVKLLEFYGKLDDLNIKNLIKKSLKGKL